MSTPSGYNLDEIVSMIASTIKTTLIVVPVTGRCGPGERPDERRALDLCGCRGTATKKSEKEEGEKDSDGKCPSHRETRSGPRLPALASEGLVGGS